MSLAICINVLPSGALKKLHNTSVPITFFTELFLSKHKKTNPTDYHLSLSVLKSRIRYHRSAGSLLGWWALPLYSVKLCNDNALNEAIITNIDMEQWSYSMLLTSNWNKHCWHLVTGASISRQATLPTDLSDLLVVENPNRVFHKHTVLTIMAILASEAFLHENKKTVINCYPSEYCLNLVPQTFRSYTLLSDLSRHTPLGISKNCLLFLHHFNIGQVRTIEHDHIKILDFPSNT